MSDGELPRYRREDITNMTRIAAMHNITEHPTTPTGVTPEDSDPARLWWCVAIATPRGRERPFEVAVPWGWSLAAWQEYAEHYYGPGCLVTPLDPLPVEALRFDFLQPFLNERPLRAGVDIRRVLTDVLGNEGDARVWCLGDEGDCMGDCGGRFHDIPVPQDFEWGHDVTPNKGGDRKKGEKRRSALFVPDHTF